MAVTPRDLDYLQWLFENGPSRTSALHLFFNPQATKQITTKRLKLLARRPHGYVFKPEQQRRNSNANYSDLIYSITEAGIDLLVEYGRITPQWRKWRKHLYGRHYHVPFWHRVLTADINASIRLAVRDNPLLRYISMFEILDQAPPATRLSETPITIDLNSQRQLLIPDEVFGIAYRQVDGSEAFRYFLREDDLGTESVQRPTSSGSSYDEKLPKYERALQHQLIKTHFGISAPVIVLTLTTAAGRVKSLIKRTRTVADQFRPFFLIRAVPTLAPFAKAPRPIPEILTTAWFRAGFPDYDISRA